MCCIYIFRMGGLLLQATSYFLKLSTHTFLMSETEKIKDFKYEPCESIYVHWVFFNVHARDGAVC